MDEVIRLEDYISSALVAGEIPATIVPRAQEILANAWYGPGTRLNRLREIADFIKQCHEKEILS